MNKLLRMTLRRYFKSTVFWISVVLTAVLAFYVGIVSRKKMDMEHTYYWMMQTMIFALPVIWHTGRENENGLFRNKIISGHSRECIYLTEMISALVICLLMFFVHLLIFICINRYIIGVVPDTAVMLVFFSLLLLNIFFILSYVTLGCLIPHRALSGAAAVLMLCFLGMASEEIYSELCRSETIDVGESLKFEYSEYISDNGDIYYAVPEYEESCEKYEYRNTLYYVSEKKDWFKHRIPVIIEKNPRYIEGVPRKILETVQMLIPSGKFEIIDWDSDFWFGYEYSDEYTPPWDERMSLGGWDEYVEEIRGELEMIIAVLAAESVFAAVLGFLVFRKKQFK